MEKSLATPKGNTSVSTFLGFELKPEESRLILENLGLVLNDADPKNGVTSTELKQFVWQSQRLGLDIFNREIFLVPRWNSKLGRNVYTPQISIDGMRLIAERTGQYLGSSEPKYEKTESNGKTIVSCTITVKKLVKEHEGEFSATVYLHEYNDSKSPLWNNKPLSMLAKVAESHALRKAFPEKMAGLYTTEEFVPESHEDTIKNAEEEFKKNGPTKKAKVEKIEIVKEEDKTTVVVEEEPKTETSPETPKTEDKAPESPQVDENFTPQVMEAL